MPSDTPTPQPLNQAPQSPKEPAGQVRTALAELLLGIDHVGVAVADLDAAIALYTDVLGFTLLARETNHEQGVDEAMLAAGPSGAGGSGAAASAVPGTARLQLLAPLGPDSTIGRFLSRSGPGLQQLALRVSDVRAAGTALQAAGLRVLYPEPRPGSEHSMINFVHPGDTSGVLIELVQTAEGR